MGTQACFSWCKLNLTHDVPHNWGITKSQIFIYSEILALFTVTSIHCIWKIKKGNINSKTWWNPKWEATENPRLKQVKNREIELINKKILKEEERKVFNTRIWLIHNIKVIYCCWRTCLIRNQKILVYVSFRLFCCWWWWINLSSRNSQTTRRDSSILKFF